MCHIFSILVVYLSSIYMMKHTEKTIDEKIQGKALVTVKKAENTKKLFIESYGCQELKQQFRYRSCSFDTHNFL